MKGESAGSSLFLLTFINYEAFRLSSIIDFVKLFYFINYHQNIIFKMFLLIDFYKFLILKINSFVKKKKKTFFASFPFNAKSLTSKFSPNNISSAFSKNSYVSSSSPRSSSSSISSTSLSSSSSDFASSSGPSLFS